MKIFISDIDGTLTYSSHPIPMVVAKELKKLCEEGWQIFLITGRNYTFVGPLLTHVNFPYLLGLQNGAAIVSMPGAIKVAQKYLLFSVVLELEKHFSNAGLEFLVEVGLENEDTCYFRKKKFSKEMLSYFALRESMASARWVAIDDFSDLTLTSVALLKCFGEKEALFDLKSSLERHFSLHITIVKDPFRESYVMLVTNAEATKGTAVDSVLKKKNYDEVIVCGDELNDLPMYCHATIKVVMATAPQQLLDIADIIVPPARDAGILTVLKSC